MMGTKPTVVVDKKGKKHAAIKIVCDVCGWEEFKIFFVQGHQHLQCSFCEKTFCDGTCK